MSYAIKLTKSKALLTHKVINVVKVMTIHKWYYYLFHRIYVLQLMDFSLTVISLSTYVCLESFVSILQIGARKATYYFCNVSKPVSPSQLGTNNELFANN